MKATVARFFRGFVKKELAFSLLALTTLFPYNLTPPFLPGELTPTSPASTPAGGFSQSPADHPLNPEQIGSRSPEC
jgi:hypothetical protein